MGKYAKTIVAVVSAVATALLTVYGPDTQVGHILTVIVAVVGALGVYLVPNAAGNSDEVTTRSGKAPY